MNFDIGTPVQVVVECTSKTDTYQLSIQKLVWQRSKTRSRFPIGSGAIVRTLNLTTPRSISRIWRARRYIDGSPVELYLPNDPVAGLEWELLSDGRVTRCKTRDYAFRREPITGPLRIGFVSTTNVDADVYESVANSILKVSEDTADVRVLDVSDWGEFQRLISATKFHAIHLLVEADVTAEQPQVLVGGLHVPLDEVIDTLARSGIRFIFLQDVTQRRNAMGMLRWGAQSLPSRCETSMVLCSVAPSAHFSAAMTDCYEGLLFDRPLGDCVTRLGPLEPHGGVSLVGHNGTRIGLGVFEDLDLSRRRYKRLLVDFDSLNQVTADLPAATARYLQTSMSETGTAAYAMAELAKTEPAVRAAEEQLKKKIEQVVDRASENLPRYPAAWFYHVDAVSETPIPDTETLTWPPPVGIVLQFHFWLDIVKSGIASITEVPEFHKLQTAAYPRQLQVTALVGRVRVRNKHRRDHAASRRSDRTCKVSGDKVAGSSKAGRVVCFPATRRDTIAAFRVEAGLTRVPETREGAQTIEHADRRCDGFASRGSTRKRADDLHYEEARRSAGLYSQTHRHALGIYRSK